MPRHGAAPSEIAGFSHPFCCHKNARERLSRRCGRLEGNEGVCAVLARIHRVMILLGGIRLTLAIP